jgi:hypothetical protein
MSKAGLIQELPSSTGYSTHPQILDQDEKAFAGANTLAYFLNGSPIEIGLEQAPFVFYFNFFRI